MRCYFDSSALVKLMITESESVKVRSFAIALSVAPVTSDVGFLEVFRVAHRVGSLPAAEAVLDGFDGYRVTTADWERARHLVPAQNLGSLDALHLACAMAAPLVSTIVTYDRRMIDAARTLGFRVESPS